MSGPGTRPAPAPGSRSGVEVGQTKTLETEHAALTQRGMVQGIKALFQGETSIAHLPGEYTDEDGVQHMNRRVAQQYPSSRRRADDQAVAKTEALEAAETEHADREQRTIVQGIKALFQGDPELKELDIPAMFEQDPMILDRRVAAALLSSKRKATDPRYPGLDAQARSELAYSKPAPGPWDGVPAALQALRPLGRYDRVTDDAWRLVNAFCEARTEDRDRQDPALYNRVDHGQGGP